MNAMAFENTLPKDCKCPSGRRFFPTHRRVRVRNVLFRLLTAMM